MSSMNSVLQNRTRGIGGVPGVAIGDEQLRVVEGSTPVAHPLVRELCREHESGDGEERFVLPCQKHVAEAALKGI